MLKKYIIVALGALIVTFNSNSTHYVRRAAAPLGTAAAMCAATYWGDKNVACKDYKFNRAVGSTAAWREYSGVDIVPGRSGTGVTWDNAFGPVGNNANAAKLRAAGINIDAADGEGYTALMDAIFERNTDRAAALLDAGANVNAMAHNGSTALMIAAEMGNTAMMRLLIDNGADVDARNEYGKTPLMAGGNDKGVITMLIRAGADVNAVDKDGGTALMNAAAGKHSDVVELLLDAGADVAMADRYGYTALKSATIWGGRGEIAGLLLQAGADPKDAFNLHRAKYRKCAWYRPWEKDKKGKTHAELLELLLAGKTVCQSN